MAFDQSALCDEWARRELRSSLRDARQLSTTSRLMLDISGTAEGCENQPGLGAALR